MDSTLPPITFAKQVLQALRKRHIDKEGKIIVPFFGRAVGFTINYSPDRAVSFGMDGKAHKVLSKAHRAGEIQLSIGGRDSSPATVGRAVINVPWIARLD